MLRAEPDHLARLRQRVLQEGDRPLLRGGLGGRAVVAVGDRREAGAVDGVRVEHVGAEGERVAARKPRLSPRRHSDAGGRRRVLPVKGGSRPFCREGGPTG